MADPTRYTPGFNYSGWEADHPTEPKPGAELDNDFAHIRHSIEETIDALKDLRRSDGKLSNAVVTFDSLNPAVKAAIAGSEFDYEVLEEFAVKAANLQDLSDKSEARENLGVLGREANLSDLTNLKEARENLGVLGREANLSDLPDKSEARENLGVLGREANLSDLTNLKEARSNLGEFATVADVKSANIPPVLDSIRVNGYYSPGDGGGALYVEGDERPGAIQSADGQWWKPCLLAGSSGILNESDLAGVTVSDALENTPGRVLLGEIILDEPYQGIIHFSDIPPDFVNLVLEYSARLESDSPSGGVLRLRTNSTGTSNSSYGGNTYLAVDSSGNVNGGFGNAVSSLHACDLPDDTEPAGVYASGLVVFYNYSTLVKAPYWSWGGTHNKHMLIRSGVNTTADETIHALLIWAGGNSIVTERDTLAAGSRFTLWGVRGNPPVAALWGGL